MIFKPTFVRVLTLIQDFRYIRHFGGRNFRLFPPFFAFFRHFFRQYFSPFESPNYEAMIIRILLSESRRYWNVYLPLLPSSPYKKEQPSPSKEVAELPAGNSTNTGRCLGQEQEITEPGKGCGPFLMTTGKGGFIRRQPKGPPTGPFQTN